jgi:hypothetical protein
MRAERSLLKRGGTSPQATECRTSSTRRMRWCRIVVAGATALGALGVPSPAFAWPMMGC